MTSEWTNLDDIRECLYRFAGTKGYPMAIVLSGDWGTGKTHLWQETLDRTKDLAKPNYAYVSLFGINSLDDLKYQLFQVLERRKEDEEEIREGVWGVYDLCCMSLSSWWDKAGTWKLAKKVDHLSGVEKNFLSKLLLLKNFPYINNIEPLVRSISFNRIRESIICIDDFERRGAGLRVSDVLGLVSLLRESRDSKVILILNEDTLSGDEKSEFIRLNEKVFDWGINLNPSPEHAIGCVIPEDNPQLKVWKSTAVKLKANNIRIIKRAYEFVKILRERYPAPHADIQFQFVHSMLLFCFSKYGKINSYPTLQKLKDFGLGSLVSRENQEETEEQKMQMAMLQSIKWAETDEVDLELIRFIEKGYLYRESLDRAISSKEALIDNQEAEQAWNVVWHIYHNSFKDNADELVEAVFTAAPIAVRIVSPYQFDQCIGILRELGFEGRAEELADYFIEQNSDNPDRLNIGDYAFSFEMRDQYFLGQLRDAFLKVPKGKDLKEVLIGIGYDSSWGGSDEEFLDERSEDELFEFLLNFEGKELPRVLDGATKFSRVSNADDRKQRISIKFKTVLERIAGLSAINSLRLQRFGIKPTTNQAVEKNGGQ